MLMPAAVLFGFVWHFATRDKAGASSGALLLFYILISRMWDNRREGWFWVATAILAFIHVIAIWLTPFKLPPGPSISYIFPIMMADGFAMYAVLTWLGSKFSRRSPNSQASSS